MSCDSRITSHIRDQQVQASSFWSRDDARFLSILPFLLGLAMLGSKSRWHEYARMLESIGDRARKNRKSFPSTAIVARQLGVTEDGLARILAASRANRTEHHIHAIHSLLRRGWRPRFEITGKQHLDEALANGKGVVLWVAHFSFASLFTKMALGQAGYAISHISRPEHGVSKSRFGIRYLNWFRSAAENRHLRRRIVHLRHQPKATREAALKALRRNELLSITVGPWEGRHFATGRLLGCTYTVSTGAPAFAFTSGAKLVPVFTTRRDHGGDYRVAIGAPLGESAVSSCEEFVHASTLELFSCHEAAIRETPEQWRGWGKLVV
jgi:lauroyl/myristoyl acyltransferase